MELERLCAVIASVETMGGDPMSEILAPSEIRAVAEAILESGVTTTEVGAIPGQRAPGTVWMQRIPPFMHDCFSA